MSPARRPSTAAQRILTFLSMSVLSLAGGGCDAPTQNAKAQGAGAPIAKTQDAGAPIALATATAFASTAAAGSSAMPPKGTTSRRAPLTRTVGMVDNWAYIQILKHTRFAPDGRFDLLLHFHIGGADDRADKAKLDAVLVSATLGRGSGAYRELFTGGYSLSTALSHIEKAVRRQSGIKNARVDRVALSTFSAGYGVAAQLLRSDDGFNRLDALLLADGIHADFHDIKSRRIANETMAPFVRFAEAAVSHNKMMLVSHSQIPTGTFASTTETADFLINKLNLPQSSSCTTIKRAPLTRCLGKGRLLIAGYEGTSEEQHMRHVHNQHRTMYRRLRNRWASAD